MISSYEIAPQASQGWGGNLWLDSRDKSHGSGEWRRPPVEETLEVKPGNRRNPGPCGKQDPRRQEHDKSRRGSGQVQTVIQQVLPRGIKGPRLYHRCRSFLLVYSAVPGCNADGKR